MTIRNRKDALLEKSVALPAAGEMNGVCFDLEQVAAGDLEQVVVELEIPATTTLVATKTLTFGIDSSPDNDGYGAQDTHSGLRYVVTGETGNGNAAKTHRFRLPVDCRRYFYVGCEAESGAGNNTAKSYTVRLLT